MTHILRVALVSASLCFCMGFQYSASTPFLSRPSHKASHPTIMQRSPLSSSNKVGGRSCLTPTFHYKERSESSGVAIGSLSIATKANIALLAILAAPLAAQALSSSSSIEDKVAEFPAIFHLTRDTIIGQLSNAQLMILGIYVPSALNKIFAPRPLKELWPTLPSWFWLPCGLWELAGAVSLVLLDIPQVGFPLMFLYMGGVFCSIVYITDAPNGGNTLVSGKSKLGMGGLFPLGFASLSTYLLTTVDSNLSSYASPLLFGCLGFACGIYFASIGENKE